MSLKRVAVGLFAVGVLAAACGSSAEERPPSDTAPGTPSAAGQIHGIDLVADLAPEDAAAVGQAVNAFGFDLLAELTNGDANTVTSPLSVATLLAMVLAGAGGDTAAAMADVLHLDDSHDVRVGALLDTLTAADDVTLSVANGLWADDGVPFEADYLAFVRDVFDATVDEVDLGAQATADEIDAWVAEHTEGLIDGIAKELRLPRADAVLALVNAVYFLGEWTTQFDPDQTVTEPFTLTDGSQVDVPLMNMTGQEFGLAERDGYRMLRMPYGADERFAMDVLLPVEGTSLSQLLADLDADEWRTAADSLSDVTLDVVTIPRFELEWTADLVPALTALGMGPAFGAADFRPMSPINPRLDTVVHKTYVKVDEAGTEAAAVTGAVMAVSAGPRFRVDKPFAFAISDQATGTVVFLGAVADPRD